MQQTTWKIGELARQSGITVRTLHHYHQIGLLTPSEFTEAGHRLYTKMDLMKLQQILSLKQMGLSLEEIHNFLENPGSNLMLIVQTRLESINEQIKLKIRLRDELEQLQTLLLSNQDIGADQLLNILEAIRMNERNYLTPDLIEKLKTFQTSLTEEQKSRMREKLSLVEETQMQALKKMVLKER